MRHPDDAIERIPKHLISLSEYQLEPYLATHLATANYRVASAEQIDTVKKPTERVFHTNNSVWEAILYQRLRRTDITIVLDGFFLFEWLPRSPGLFHTKRGRDARREAEDNIESIRDGLIIYNPYGKASMLDGGVGNVRLKPVDVRDKSYVFMAASSSGICHEGFPVAIPIEFYNHIIDEITARGAVVRRLVGKLKFIPDDLSELYRGYTEVPQLYLDVENVLPPIHVQSRHMEELRVSVAASFMSDYEGYNRAYATYVNFDPSEQDSLRRAAEWIEQDYVVGRYRGRVITDFDQQQGHFATAPFSLEKVMKLKLTEAEVRDIASKLHVNGERALTHQRQIVINIEEFYMDSKFKITGGNIGAVGDQAQAHNIIQVSNQTLGSIDMMNLASDLARLRTEARSEATEPEHDIAVSEIAKAEKAAQEGQGSKVVEHLKAAGKWALDIATKIGTDVAAEAIKKSTGL
jgi:hypothetical protein